mmetsp:Transcript_37737/g.118757  ORF Transcript_37737/g.118757 Transcript_37737/m.118757 type:complete len:335 (+) Transcript_37737:763-1767(+)
MSAVPAACCACCAACCAACASSTSACRKCAWAWPLAGGIHVTVDPAAGGGVGVGVGGSSRTSSQRTTRSATRSCTRSISQPWRCIFFHVEYTDFVRPVTDTDRMRPCSHSSEESKRCTLSCDDAMTSSYCGAIRSMYSCTSMNSAGKRYLKDRSESSVLYAHRPSRCASGAKICSVSRAVAARLWGGMCCSVRMLCSRSASLTTTMRQSSAIAMNMERRFSACSSVSETSDSTACACAGSTPPVTPPPPPPPPNSAPAAAWPSASSEERTIFGSLETFVSPSTILRTVAPKSASMAAKSSSVSSTVSCSSPAMSDSLSIEVRARIADTSTGWVM